MSQPITPSSKARQAILQRLRASVSATPIEQVLSNPPPPKLPMPCPTATPSALRQQFIEHITTAHAEVHSVTAENWQTKLAELCISKQLPSLLAGKEFQTKLNLLDLAMANPDCTTQVKIYDTAIETWKAELFHDMAAGLTTARAAIAETGTLILWPSADAPRLLSLVPPVHFVLLAQDMIYPTFAAAIATEGWGKAGVLPSNALLISGPSKTADIQQTLAYGAHGPKELIVLLLEQTQ